MPYHLLLHFDSDAFGGRRRPKEVEGGGVDHYDLGYVNNVVQDEVLAQWRTVSAQEAAELDPRFVFPRKTLAAGENCTLGEDDPDRILAQKNGYAEYSNGRINVKTLLQVPGGINFTTGNILFVGDLVVHGAVSTGFSLQARNIMVKGTIGGASVTAQGSVIAESGVKGAKEAVLTAGKNIRVPFCENARLVAGESLFVDGACMHCDLYVGKQIAVKTRLIGGDCYCHRLMYVKEQLGGGIATETNVTLGFDPLLLLKANDLDETLVGQTQRVADLEALLRRHPELVDEYGGKLEKARKRLNVLNKQRQTLEDAIVAGDVGPSCALAVPGEVRAGVTVSIGNAYYSVMETLRDVRFTLAGDEIVVSSPAMKK